MFTLVKSYDIIYMIYMTWPCKTQVFGKSKLYWLIPVYSERDKQNMHVLEGLEYPERPDNEEQYFN